MSASPEYPDELRQRAVRMVLDIRQETGDRPDAIKQVAAALGVPARTVWQWVE